MGTFDVTIGERTFETIKFFNIRENSTITEDYVDINGRLVLMRWYESKDALELTEYYTDEFRSKVMNNPKLVVNNIDYYMLEDRISEYAL